MDANQKKKVIVWVSVATILGVGGYFAYNWWRNRPKKEDEESKPQIVYIPDPNSAGAGGGATGGGPTSEQIELAKAYRIWANSTDELSKMYGKKSKYDLDATTSSPYNSWFLKSYAAGKDAYSKSTNTTPAAEVKPPVSQWAKTQTNDWYKLKAGKLVNYFVGFTYDSDRKQIVTILKQLNTDGDWQQLFNDFGKRSDGNNFVWDPRDLRWWISHELTNKQRADVNSNWAKKGMTKQLYVGVG